VSKRKKKKAGERISWDLRRDRIDQPKNIYISWDLRKYKFLNFKDRGFSKNK
jgi:hypothetical protein